MYFSVDPSKSDLMVSPALGLGNEEDRFFYTLVWFNYPSVQKRENHDEDLLQQFFAQKKNGRECPISQTNCSERSSIENSEIITQKRKSRKLV